MYIIHNINNINIKDIYFGDSIKNTVLINGKFTRLLYSTSLYILNTLLLQIKMTDLSIENIYNKYKCIYSVDKNMQYIKKIEYLEKKILEKIVSKKKRVYNIKNQLYSGCIKLFTNSPIQQNKTEMVLKISGVWETYDEIGITYKFMIVNEIL